MIKFLLGFFTALFLIGALWITEAWRKTELLQDLEDCQVQKVAKHNSFYVIRMECNYFDGVILWKILETLYISKNGYIIKSWH